jgi:hypothetical protein
MLVIISLMVCFMLLLCFIIIFQSYKATIPNENEVHPPCGDKEKHALSSACQPKTPYPIGSQREAGRWNVLVTESIAPREREESG